MGLYAEDLKHLVYDIFEIDSYKSKMGNDKDIVTLSFSVRDQNPANDLMNFIEKGYEFVLDADVTPGEQSDGTYKVFVEIERGRHTSEQIMEIADGVKKLAGLDDFKYRYYKNFHSIPLSQESLEETLPTDADAYESLVNESNLNNYSNFFNRSLVESVVMSGDRLTIKKAYADPVQFNFIGYGDRESMFATINETMNVNDFAEVIFLTKYIGDYNISKFGNKLVLENQGRALVLERILI